jgi:nucleotide-binding universal stress UspA family protein
MFDSLRNSGWAGVAVLVGAAALAPTLWPAVGRATRPAAKSALKAGLVTAEQARERLAELGEAAEDLWAEVRWELDEERRAGEAGEAADDAAERSATDAV